MTLTAQALTYRCPHCGIAVEVDPSTASELLTCPAEGCGKPFQAKMPAAHPVADLVLPGHAGGTNGVAQAPLAKPAADVETEPYTVHLAMFRRYPIRCFLYVLLIAGLAACGIWLAWQDWIWPAVACWAGALVVVGRLIFWRLRMQSTTLAITNKRTVLTSGIFSRQTSEADLDDVSDIMVRQDLLMRICRVGDLVVLSGNGNEKSQLTLMGVPDPQLVVERMQNRGRAPEPKEPEPQGEKA